MAKPLAMSGVVSQCTADAPHTRLPNAAAPRGPPAPAAPARAGRARAPRDARRPPRRRPRGPRALRLHVRLRLHGGGHDLGRLPALRHRAGLVAESGPGRPAGSDRALRLASGAPDRAARASDRPEAGEGNRTPIFGLGSQRLDHWTTPARASRIPIAPRLPLNGMRAARLLARHHRRRAARGAARVRPHDHRHGHDARRRDGARRARRRRRARARCRGSAATAPARSPTTGARSCSSTSGPRGATPCRDELPLIEQAHKTLAARGGTVLGIDVKENSAPRSTPSTSSASRIPNLRDRDGELRAQVGPDRLSGDLRDRPQGPGRRRAPAARSRRSGSTRRCRRCSTSRRDARALAARAARRSRCSRPAAAAARAARLAARHRGRGDVPGMRDGAERLRLRRGRPGARLHRRADRPGQDQGSRSRTRSWPSTARACSPSPRDERLRPRPPGSCRCSPALAALALVVADRAALARGARRRRTAAAARPAPALDPDDARRLDAELAAFDR